jgi:hypothetical protein
MADVICNVICSFCKNSALIQFDDHSFYEIWTGVEVNIYIFVKLQLGFNSVAVIQQYNRQITHITHKHNTKTQQ